MGLNKWFATAQAKTAMTGNSIFRLCKSEAARRGYYENVGALDRVLRAILGESLVMAGFFWSHGAWSLLIYACGLYFALTGLLAVCPAYRHWGYDTLWARPQNAIRHFRLKGLLLVALIGMFGLLFSMVFSKLAYVNDFNRMNGYYKGAWYYSERTSRDDAKKNFDGLVVQYGAFRDKYSSYRPYVLRWDERYDEDIDFVYRLIIRQKAAIYSGNMREAAAQLEIGRGVFDDIFQRNGIFTLSIPLMSFHQPMQLMVEAGKKGDCFGVIDAYPLADERLNEIEQEEGEDAISMREALEELRYAGADCNKDALATKARQMWDRFDENYLING